MNPMRFLMAILYSQVIILNYVASTALAADAASATQSSSAGIVSPKLREDEDNEVWMSTPMPMHRRFLQERRRHRHRQLYSIISNDVVFESTEAKSNAEGNEYSPLSSSRLASYNPLEEGGYADHSIDILSSPWWIMLNEGQRKPQTRRSHAATVYSINAGTTANQNKAKSKSKAKVKAETNNAEKERDTSPPPVVDTVPPTSSETQPVPVENVEEEDALSDIILDVPDVVDTPEVTVTENDSSIDNMGTSTSTSDPKGDDGEKTISPIVKSTNQPSATVTVSDTTDSDENTRFRLRRQRHRSLQENENTNSNSNSNPSHNQEYMIITGGFSDNDWENFPVWAYDMTMATLSEEGLWYELTPPPAMTAAQHQEMCVDSSSSNSTKAAVDPTKGWGDTAVVVPCGPTARVGHISLVRHDFLYVFGGLQYNDKDGIFFMEEEPYMYRMKLKQNKFQERDKNNYEGYYSYVSNNQDDNPMYWERMKTNVKSPTPDTCTLRSNGKECVVSRGEVRGGYWVNEDKLIIYGGLKVREYETSTGYEQQSDTTLGDVWAYDFETYTWEMLSTRPSQISIASTGEEYPLERTSHAATVVGDELVIYGGLKKDTTYPWDGSTVWEQLDDVWVFDLRSRQWKQRMMMQSEGRSYQSAVGWKNPENEGTILAAFGGYKTMMDPVDNQEVSYVYDDTLLSIPQRQNSTTPSIWYLAQFQFDGISTEIASISTRLEHTAVLSPQFGNMIVWGGRYRSTNDINGVWSLNIAGEDSNVKYTERSDDHEMANVGFAYVVLVIVMMMSMMFTYMCGIIHRRVENDEAINLEALNADPTLGGTVFGRNGLSQDIIDTLPLRIYTDKPSETAATGGTEESNEEESADSNNPNASGDDFNYNDEDDENCCAICLVEYDEGDEMRCLPCGHEYHKDCVDSWLANQASCPACRHSLSDLAAFTTRASLANTLRASIAARIAPSTTTEPIVQRRVDDQQQQQQQPPQPLPPPPQSPPSSPEQGIAPGVRTVQALRRMLHRRRRGISSVPSNDSSVSPPRALSPRSSDDESASGDLELSYSSSLELTEEFELRHNYSSDGDLPIEGRRRQMRIGDRRQMMRGRGRRERRVRGGARSPLNAPLQPSDASIV